MVHRTFPLLTSYRLPLFALSLVSAASLLTRLLCSFLRQQSFVLFLLNSYFSPSHQIPRRRRLPIQYIPQPNSKHRCLVTNQHPRRTSKNIKQGLTTTLLRQSTTIPTPAPVLQFLRQALSAFFSTSLLDLCRLIRLWSSLELPVPRLVPLPTVSLTHDHRSRTSRFGANSTSLVWQFVKLATTFSLSSLRQSIFAVRSFRLPIDDLTGDSNRRNDTTFLPYPPSHI